MRALKLLFFLLLFSLTSGCEQSSPELSEIKDAQRIKTNQYVEPIGDEPWTIVYALATLWGSINISYGIEDYKLFEKLEAKKNAGDPNASYAYALYNLDYGFSTPEEQDEALESMITLTKQGHPFAAGYFAGKDNEYLMEIAPRFGITTKEELIEAKTKWFETAIKGGNRLYKRYALFLLWHDEQPDNLILKDWALYNDNPKVAKIVFDNFYAHATKSRSPFSAAYVAEAYYLGVGVEKDLTRAYAWAKLVASNIKIDCNGQVFL